MKHVLIICLFFIIGCGEFAGDPGIAYWQVQQMNRQNPNSLQNYNPPMFYQPAIPDNFWQEQYYMQKALQRPSINTTTGEAFKRYWLD